MVDGRRLSMLAALLSALAFGAGCGGGDEGSDETSQEPPAAPVSTSSPPRECTGDRSASDSEGTTPGESATPHPTLEHLSVVWEIQGDANADASVAVRVRESGGEWRDAAPLRRVPAGAAAGVSWSDRFAGSIFGLEPGTTYEIELSLVDPDGGCDTRILEAATRAVPAAPAGAPVVEATPATFTAQAASAPYGAVIDLAPGTYPALRFGRKGTVSEPFVIRAGDDVTFAGGVNLQGAEHVVLEGGSVNGQVNISGTSGVAVVGTTVRTADDGIVMRAPAEDSYIADNTVEGPTDWEAPALGAQGSAQGEGILVTGPGHVIEHNRVTGFHDGISFLEDALASDQESIDVLRNDISIAADDGVEADFCVHNCRIAENRLTNTFIALSSQPGLGGPTYFVRNAIYNTILTPFKLHRGSQGDVIVHNTVVKNGDALGIQTAETFSHQLFRNNLLIGGPGGEYNGWLSGPGLVVDMPAADPSVDMDYDGFGSTTGEFEGQLGTDRFASLAELRSRTTERHAVAVRLDVFATEVPYPGDPLSEATAPDLAPAAGGAAEDAGLPMPGLNDSYAGDAPDLGALEAGATAPAYGPRSTAGD